MPFAKGASGNPSGRPKENKEIKELARKHAPEAFKKIISLMQGDDAKISLQAAQEVLNRAYGKPAQSVDVSDEGGTIAAAILQFIKKDA